MVQSVLSGSGQQFVDGDKHHDPGHSRKDETKKVIIQERR
jgi:hypothetical protein